jgi:glycosyltransferase involved in cell wall biosynthesis
MSTQSKKLLPFVTIVTPTYNRRRFIPHLIQMVENQDYKKDRMEWIVLDDGQEEVKDLFDEAAKRIPNLRYILLDEKLTIGAKRNRLNDEAKGSIIVAMDDDDYYPPCRVSAVVNALNDRKNTAIELCGASEIYMYYSDIQKIYKLGPYNPNHATNGTMAWRSSYAKTHRYDEDVTHSEERSFLDDYKNKMIQLDPFKVMLVMSHSDNTFDKKKLREQENPYIKKTDLKLKDFLKEPREKELLEFFANA